MRTVPPDHDEMDPDTPPASPTHKAIMSMVDNYTHFESMYRNHMEEAAPVLEQVEKLRSALETFRVTVAERTDGVVVPEFQAEEGVAVVVEPQEDEVVVAVETQEDEVVVAAATQGEETQEEAVVETQEEPVATEEQIELPPPLEHDVSSADLPSPSEFDIVLPTLDTVLMSVVEQAVSEAVLEDDDGRDMKDFVELECALKEAEELIGKISDEPTLIETEKEAGEATAPAADELDVPSVN